MTPNTSLQQNGHLEKIGGGASAQSRSSEVSSDELLSATTSLPSSPPRKPNVFTSPFQYSLDGNVEKWEASYKGLYDAIQRTHTETLRRLRERQLQQVQSAPAKDQIKVGRNAPCICGSGTTPLDVKPTALMKLLK